MSTEVQLRHHRQQAHTVEIGCRHPMDIGPVSVFLGINVRSIQILYPCCINSHPVGFPAVGIGLAGAPAIPLKAVQIPGYLHLQSDPRQGIRKGFALRRSGNLQDHIPAPTDAVDVLRRNSPGQHRRRNSCPYPDNDAVILFVPCKAVGTMLHGIQSKTLPFLSDFSFIVRGSMPEIQPGPFHQEGFSLISPGFQDSINFIKHQAEVFSSDHKGIFFFPAGKGRHPFCFHNRGSGDRQWEPELCPGDFIAPFGPVGIFAQQEPDIHQIIRLRLRILRNLIRQYHLHISSCRNLRKLQRILLQYPAIRFQGPGRPKMIQAEEIIVIEDPDDSFFQIHFLHLDRLNDLFIFRQSGRRCPIRENQSVYDEIPIIGLISEIAAVGIIPFSLFILFRDAVVQPFPDKTTLQPFISVKCFPIFLQPAGTISHGMCILTENMGVFHRFPSHFLHFLNGGIHGAVDITGLQLIILLFKMSAGFPFIVNQTCRILGFDPSIHRFMVPAKSGFIAQGPEKDGRMILIPLHHSGNPVDIGVLPFRIVTQSLIAMGFQIGFIDQVQAVFVT